MPPLRRQPRSSPRREQERRLFAWTLLACILLLGVMAAPYYLGRIYTSDDLWTFHLPVRQFYAQCLAAGDSFDWMPNLYSGFYLTGEGQAGTYHPLHWLLYRFLPLRAAFDLELLLNYPFMLAGGFFFFRRHVGRRDAALVGAMAFTFGGFNMLHFVHPNAIAVVAHIPWLLLAIDVAVRGTYRRYVVAAQAAIALLTASQLLLGYPQYVWFSLVAEAGYALFVLRTRTASGGRQPPDPAPLATAANQGADAPRSPIRVALFKLLGLLIGALQLLPTMDALDKSERQVVDADFIHQGALHPINIIQLFAPYLFRDRVVGGNTHEFGLYAGAAPLVLTLWLALRWEHLGQRMRRFAGAAMVLGGVALLLALGRYGGLYIVQTWLPLVGKFRLPARAIMLVQLSIAALTAVAFTDLVRFVGRRREDQTPARQPSAGGRGSLAPLWRLVGLSFALALAAGWMWGEHAAPLWLRLAGVLPLVIAILLVRQASAGRRWALTAVVYFMAADLGVYGCSYAIHANTYDMATAISTMSTLPEIESLTETGKPKVAIDLRDPQQPGLRHGNQLLLKGWRQVDGYAGLEPARALDYRQVSALRVAGVHLVRRNAASENIAGLEPYDAHWLKVPHPLQRVRCVHNVVQSANPRDDLKNIAIETTVLTQERIPLSGTCDPGDVQILRDQPGHITLLVEKAAREQLLVVSERYHPGWHVVVDDRPQAVHRVNGEFLGCLVPGGGRLVELRFQPPSLWYSKLLTVGGSLLLAVYCLMALRGFRVQGSGFSC
jgi:hypothetical protein